MEIRTERLRFAPHGPETVAPMHEIASDFDVVRMTPSWPWHADRAFTESRCGIIAEETGFVGAIWRGDRVIGGMGVIAGEMGYFLHREAWGKGYATEMAQAVIARAFDRYDWEEITAAAWVDNPASVRVLQKLGFENRPDSVEECAARGERVLARNFALTRVRYESLRNRAA